MSSTSRKCQLPAGMVDETNSTKSPSARTEKLIGSRHLRKHLSNHQLTTNLTKQRLQWPHTHTHAQIQTFGFYKTKLGHVLPKYIPSRISTANTVLYQAERAQCLCEECGIFSLRLCVSFTPLILLLLLPLNRLLLLSAMPLNLRVTCHVLLLFPRNGCHPSYLLYSHRGTGPSPL